MRFQPSLSIVLLAFAFVHARPISKEEIATKTSQGLRLLSLAEGADPVWKTEEGKLDLIRSGVKFVSKIYHIWSSSNSHHYISSM